MRECEESLVRLPRVRPLWVHEDLSTEKFRKATRLYGDLHADAQATTANHFRCEPAPGPDVVQSDYLGSRPRWAVKV